MQDCWHRYWVLRHSARSRGHQCSRNSPSRVLSTVRLDYLRPDVRTLFRVGVCLGRAHFCQSFLTWVSGASAMDVPSTVLHTGPQTSLNPPGSMGCRCTTPAFWNGSVLRSRLDYWIKVLVLGCTRCPVSRPLTLPANNFGANLGCPGLSVCGGGCGRYGSPGSSGFIWRPWVSGALRWIRLVVHELLLGC